MILLNKQNFSAQRFHRDHSSPPSPNDTFHSHIRICLVLNGSARWEIEGRSFLVEKGHIVFLNMGQKRRFLSFSKEGFDLCIFTFPRNAFADLQHYIFFKDYAKKSPLQHPALALILQQILDFWESGHPLRHQWASAKLTEFFICAEQLEHYTQKSNPPKNLEILTRMDQIDESIATGLGLYEIAKASGLSESTFSRRFYGATGISFKQYAMEKKIYRALELLKNTDLKIIDISAECGFQSISGFYDTFRKFLGTTPNKIRSQF